MQSAVLAIVTFLGGAATGSAITWLKEAESARAKLRVETWQRQNSELYSPILFYAKLNKSVADLNSQLSERYREEYCDKQWSDDEMTQKNLDRETTATIDVMNRYTALLTERNRHIAEIIERSFHLAEPDDVPVFERFMLSRMRFEIEVSKDDAAKIPRRIQRQLEGIRLFDTELITHVESKSSRNRERVDRFSRSWFAKSV